LAFWDPVSETTYMFEIDPADPKIPVDAIVTVPPLQYTRNATATNVTRDTATAANNRPLPVELMAGDSAGPIDYNAGNASAATQRVVIATDQAPIDVEVTASVLPTGAATEATQLIVATETSETSTNTLATALAVTSIDGKTPALVGGRVPVDVGASVLPTGAATETTLSALNTKVANDFGASSGAVRAASQIGNATGAADFNAGTSGAQTVRVAANLYNNGAALTYGVGLATSATLRVAAVPVQGGSAVDNTNPLATDLTTLAGAPITDALPTRSLSGASVQLTSSTVHPYFQDFSSSSLTTSYTQVIAATGTAIQAISAVNNSSTAIRIATGAAASEVVRYIVMPGENTSFILLNIPSGTRISIATQTGTLSSGQFSLNAFAG
jgi:hypothetical protein